MANYVRYPLSGNWSGFTGLINVTGAGFSSANVNTVGAVSANIDELRINNSYSYTNATIYLTQFGPAQRQSPANACDVPDRGQWRDN